MIGSVVDLAIEERRSMLALIESLTADQWRAQSLCGEWTVREVVAHHIGYDLLSGPELLTRMVTGRADPGPRSNRRRVADDLGWTFGRGPEVRGTGEAILLAMGGRTIVLDELRGPGRDRLARNLGALA